MNRLYRSCLLLLGLSLLSQACGEPESQPPPAASDLVHLPPYEQVTRLSMALRGVRPSVEDLLLVRDNPDHFERIYRSLAERYLESEEFGETIKDLHAELYLLRTDTEIPMPPEGPLAGKGYNHGDTYISTTEAPLNFVRDIVMQDQPYTDVVTAQYTLADPVVAIIYGLPYDPDGPQWQRTHWSDGRPLAGLLSDSQIWRRYTSSALNNNRGRANFISTAFLCENIASREIAPTTGLDLSDPEVINNAVKTNPNCTACHANIDPLASFLWGYKSSLGGQVVSASYDADCEGNYFPDDPLRSNFEVEHYCYPVRLYNPVDADIWKRFDLPAPALYGVPGENMTDLGHLIAQDPRFAECTARTFAGYFTQADRLTLPGEYAIHLREILEAEDFSIKRFLKRLVMSDAFRSARRRDPLYSDALFVAGLQTIRPEQYARTLEDLTGFRWLADFDPNNCNPAQICRGNQDLSESDLYGYRSIAGGIDGTIITQPSHTATPTKMLVMSRQADEAAGFVVGSDFESPPEQRKLLSLVGPETTDEAPVRAQLVWLHARILGELLENDSEAIDESYALWSGIYERTGDTGLSWRVTISALLQDVRMIYY